jgi:polygalacturonase
MSNDDRSNSNSLSRRSWLGAVSAPAVAAVVSSALISQPLFADLAAVNSPSDANLAGSRVFNIRDFGAKGDGTTLDTQAVQAAIDACAKDQGGTVLVPAGTFLIAPIQLKSNVTLHIAAAGKLLATTDKSLYHPAEGIPLNGDHTMVDGNVGLVHAANALNITIEGPGTIDGQGAEVRAAGLSGRMRCHLVLLYRCNNVTIRNIYLYHSSYHTCRICNCSGVLLDGIRINSRVTGNNDGFHFISAEFVNMTNCNVRSQDDACALFGSCRFITITNSTFSTRWSVFRFGGGVAENIAVSNCILYQVFGCPMKLRCEPGSRLENISFSNILLQEVTGPISVGAGPMPGRTPRAGAATQPAMPNDEIESSATRPAGPAIVRNISFSNITGTVTTKQGHLDDSHFTGSTNPGELHSCIIINGVEGQSIVENISFSDIRLTFGGGGTAEEAARRDLPQVAGEYFALGPMPAYGLYARNVRGLTLNSVRFEVTDPDLRPALIFDNVQDATISALSAQANSDAESLLRFIQCRDVLITSPRVLTPASIFLRIEGSKSRTITIDGGDVSKAQQALAFSNGANQDSVKMRGSPA